MKIVQISPRYSPALGGVEEVVKQYSEGLSKLGHEVKVLTSQENDTPTDEVLNGVNVLRFASVGKKTSRPIVPIAPLLPAALLKGDADIYHLHANKRFITDSSALVLKSQGKKFVFNPHAGQFGSSLLGRVHNKLFGNLTMSAQLILCVSEFEKELIKHAGFSEANLAVLPNGVDLSEFENIKKGYFTEHGWANKKVILCVARLVRHKNVDVLIRAFNLIAAKPNLRLAIVGPDGGELSNLANLVRELGLVEKVKFFGGISRSDLLRVFADADVFALPSSSEAFGLSVVEAMAARMPVVVSDLCALPEIVKHKKNGLLSRVDPKELSENIELLLEERKLSEALTTAAAEDVAKKYNWDSIVKKLEKHYEEIL